MSRTPIREALLQLAALGLVAFRPRQGIIVTRLSVQQVVAMTEMLPALESLCAELAARRMSPEERKRLKILSDKAVACAEAADPDGYEKANKQVQQAIRLGSHNRYLIDRIGDIHKRIHPYWPPGIHYFGTMVMERLLKEQKEVVDAILAGDDDRAREAMRSHLVYRAGHFMDTITSFGSDKDHAHTDDSFRAQEAN